MRDDGKTNKVAKIAVGYDILEDGTPSISGSGKKVVGFPLGHVSMDAMNEHKTVYLQAMHHAPTLVLKG